MQRKPMKLCMIRKTRCITMTQEKLTQTNCPISTLFAEDSLVKVFQSLESEKDLMTQEERCSLKLPGLPPLKDLSICSLKTFPDSYRMTGAGRLRPSSMRFQNWGTASQDTYRHICQRRYRRFAKSRQRPWRRFKNSIHLSL